MGRSPQITSTILCEQSTSSVEMETYLPPFTSLRHEGTSTTVLPKYRRETSVRINGPICINSISMHIFDNLCGTLQKGLFGTPPASGVTELTHLGPFF